MCNIVWMHSLLFHSVLCDNYWAVNESALVVLCIHQQVLGHWVIYKWTPACIQTKQDLLCESGLCSCRYCMSLLCSCVLSLCSELSLCLRAASKPWIRSTCFSTRDVWARKRAREERDKKRGRGKGKEMGTKVKDYKRLKMKHQEKVQRVRQAMRDWSKDIQGQRGHYFTMQILPAFASMRNFCQQ